MQIKNKNWRNILYILSKTSLINVGHHRVGPRENKKKMLKGHETRIQDFTAAKRKRKRSKTHRCWYIIRIKRKQKKYLDHVKWATACNLTIISLSNRPFVRVRAILSLKLMSLTFGFFYFFISSLRREGFFFFGQSAWIRRSKRRKKKNGALGPFHNRKYAPRAAVQGVIAARFT